MLGRFVREHARPRRLFSIAIAIVHASTDVWFQNHLLRNAAKVMVKSSNARAIPTLTVTEAFPARLPESLQIEWRKIDWWGSICYEVGNAAGGDRRLCEPQVLMPEAVQ